MRRRPQSPPDARARRARLRRAGRYACAVAALIGAVCATLLVAGFPQQWALEWGGRRFLDARFEVAGSAFLRPIAVAHLGVYDDGPGASPRPLMQVDGLRLPYRLGLTERRRFPELRADRVCFEIEGVDPSATNYGFARRLLSKPSTGFDLTPYLPETLHIAEVTASVEMPDWGGAIEGVRLDGWIGSLDSFSLRLSGDAVVGRAWSDRVGVGTPRIERGTVDLPVRRGRDGIEVGPAEIRLPHVMDLAGRARYDASGDGTRLDVDLHHADITGAAAAGPLAALSPVPAQFDRLTVTEGAFAVRRPDTGSLALEHARLVVRVADLIVGPHASPYYAGDVALTAEVRADGGRADVKLAQGQELTLAVSGTPGGRRVQGSIAGWSRDELIGALPAAVRPRLDAFPALLGIAAEADITTSEEGAEGRIHLTPTLQGGDGDASVSVEGAWSRSGEALFEGRLIAALPELQAEADVSFSDPTRSAWDVAVARADVQPVARLFGVALPGSVRGVARGGLHAALEGGLRASGALEIEGLIPDQRVKMEIGAASSDDGQALPVDVTLAARLPDRREAVADVRLKADSDARVEGEVVLRDLRFADLTSFAPVALFANGGAALSGTVRFALGSEEIRGRAALDWRNPVFGTFALPGETPITVQGPYTYRRESGTLAFDGVTATWGEALRAQLTRWAVGMEGPRITGSVDLQHLDLATFAAVLGIEGLVVGSVHGTAPLRYDGSALTATPELAATDLRVGPWVADEEAHVKGQVSFSVEEGKVLGQDVEAAADAANVIRIGEFSYALSGEEASADFNADTDLTPLVDAGVLSAATGGAARLEGRWVRANGEDVIEFNVPGLTSDALVLPADRAGLVDVRASGAGAIGSGREASGAIRAAELAAGGVVAREAGGAWRVRSGRLTCERLSAAIFGGSVSGSLTQQVDAAPFAGSFTGVLEGIDLARFTEEFKPPYARLTGLASGDFEVRWSAEGVEYMRVHLLSDRGFTLNRDILEKLLLSEYTQGMIAEKTIEAIRESVLGGAEARPFDKAELSMETQGERYVGPLLLQSEALDLTIDLLIDQQVVVEFLQLRHEANLEDIANIDFGTVE